MWYSVRARFRCEVQEASDERRLWEESILVIRAAGDEAARRKAVDAARDMEHGYLNDQGETVRWVFVSVEEVQDLCEDEIRDGTEVYSRLYFESSGEADPSAH